MNACDPHQGRNIGAFDHTNAGSDAAKIANNSKNHGDCHEGEDLFHAATHKA
jgi:hypothetical protein